MCSATGCSVAEWLAYTLTGPPKFDILHPVPAFGGRPNAIRSIDEARVCHAARQLGARDLVRLFHDVASARTKHRSDIQITVRRIPLSGALDHFLRCRSLRLIRQVTRPRRVRSSTSTSSISRWRTRRQLSNLTSMGPGSTLDPVPLDPATKGKHDSSAPRRAEWWSTSHGRLRYSGTSNLLKQAVESYQAGRLDEAEGLCKAIPLADADYVHALHLLG